VYERVENRPHYPHLEPRVLASFGRSRKVEKNIPRMAPVRECRTRRARSSADFAASYMKHLLRLSRANNPEK